MKTKIIYLALLIIMTITLFSGCTSNEFFTVRLLKDDEVIMTATSNAEAELKAVKLSDGTPLFKNIKIAENKGLFYNSYTINVTTNMANSADKYQLKATMPGNIGQIKGGKIDGDMVIFKITDLTQENDFAVYSDSSNTATVIIIICVLTVIAAAFVYFIKRKQG